MKKERLSHRGRKIMREIIKNNSFVNSNVSAVDFAFRKMKEQEITIRELQKNILQIYINHELGINTAKTYKK